jgi:hypothetical protein
MYQGAKWIYWRHDFQSALYYWRKGQLTLRDWWRSWRGPKTSAVFSRRDPAPFLADLFQSLALFLGWRKKKSKASHPSPTLRDFFSQETTPAAPITVDENVSSITKPPN